MSADIEKPNFTIGDYKYSVVIHYSKVKPGMMIIEGDDYDKETPIYFMCKVEEISYKEASSFKIHIVAYNKDNKETIYDWNKEVSIDPMFYEDLTERIYFKTIDEAKAFGFKESQLEKANLEWCFKQ